MFISVYFVVVKGLCRPYKRWPSVKFLSRNERNERSNKIDEMYWNNKGIEANWYLIEKVE